MQNALRDDALLGLENKNAVFSTPEEKAQQKAQQNAQRNLDAARQPEGVDVFQSTLKKKKKNKKKKKKKKKNMLSDDIAQALGGPGILHPMLKSSDESRVLEADAPAREAHKAGDPGSVTKTQMSLYLSRKAVMDDAIKGNLTYKAVVAYWRFLSTSHDELEKKGKELVRRQQVQRAIVMRSTTTQQRDERHAKLKRTEGLLSTTETDMAVYSAHVEFFMNSAMYVVGERS